VRIGAATFSLRISAYLHWRVAVASVLEIMQTAPWNYSIQNTLRKSSWDDSVVTAPDAPCSRPESLVVLDIITAGLQVEKLGGGTFGRPRPHMQPVRERI
jgi:hypothetical protein